MENSKIEWTNHTGNLWIGCTACSPGCDNCYAEAINKRWGRANWGLATPRMVVKGVWANFRKWDRQANSSGRIHRVFVGSMMDIAEKNMFAVDNNGTPIGHTDEHRQRYFGEVVPNTPNLLHLLLTKRPGNINKYTPDSWKSKPPKNVMFGTSPVTQATADILIPQLLEVPGRRFLSIEPQLECINLRMLYKGMNRPLEGIDWVIVGGESGHRRRPFDTDWARDIRDACAEFNVPFFMKQVDKVLPIPQDLMIRQFPPEV